MRVRALNAVPLRLRDRSGSYCRWIDGRSCYGAFCEVQCPHRGTHKHVDPLIACDEDL